MSEPKPAYIELSGPHTHRGVDCNKGDVIKVREDQAARLVKNGHKSSTEAAYNKQQAND
jgi:hypothetical protein